MSGLFCEHALSPLKQSDVALDVLAIGDLGAAAVGFSHGDEAPYLRAGGKEPRVKTEKKENLPVPPNPLNDRTH